MRHHYFGHRCWYKVLLYSATVALSIFYFQSGIAQISLGGVDIPYTQDFNTLAFGGGTGSTMPAHWVFLETGAGSNGTYAVDAGATSTENTYSYGTGAATERALGQINTAAFSTTAGASFINNTGVTITSLLIQYFGEQWRIGTLGRTDRIDFQYSTNATAINNGTWTDFDGLDFTGPIQAGVVGALDGNAAANRTLLAKTISGLSIATGATVWIRWNSFEATGNDDGLAIDDFVLTPNPSLHYTVNNNGVTLSITDTGGNGEGLYVTQQGTSIRFYAPGRTYSLNAGATTALPIDVTIAGLSFIVINAGTGNDTIHVGAFTSNLPGFTINGGIGNDVVNMNGDINFISGAAFNADLQNDDASPGVDQFNVAANANIVCAGTGISTIKVSSFIVLNSLSSVSTSNGNLTVEANQQFVPTTGDFNGIEIMADAWLQATAGGSVIVKGRGGNTGSINYGIYVHDGGEILGGTSGTLTVEGTGGPCSGSSNAGIAITQSTSRISSGGANVVITGTGGGVGSTSGSPGILMNSGGVFSAGGTGTVTVTGTGAAMPGVNFGISIANDATITSTNGNVLVTGFGGGSTGSNNYGVYLWAGGIISAGGGGTVTVNGTGGNSTGNANDGVTLYTGDAMITSSGGDVMVTGQGGGAINSGSGVGVHLTTDVSITAGGLGDVTVTGTGASINGVNNFGIFLQETTASITSNGGNVTLIGQGGGSGTSSGNYGIIIFQSTVSAGGTGLVSLTGTGGSSSGANNVGIRVSEVGGKVTSGGGNITLTGIEGSGPDGFGISVYSSGTVTTIPNGGSITLNGNSINIASTISTVGSNSVAIRPYTNGVDVFLGPGTNSIGGPLHLSDTELDFVTAASIIIGNVTTGDITVSSPITRAALTNMSLLSNDNVILDGGNINTNGGNLSLDPGGVPDAVKPLQTGNDATCATLTLLGRLSISIDGTVADVSYAQMQVVGAVQLSNVSLAFSGTHVPQPGNAFTIVVNDGADAVSGTFIGLPQGSTIVNFMGSGLPATISYTGGTGNDIVITVGAPDYLITNSGGILSIVDFAGNGEILSISQNLTNIRFDVLTRTYSLNGGAITNFPIDIAIAGLTSITADVAVGSDVINVAAFTTALPSLTLNGGTGDETINFNGDISFVANASLNVDLQNDDAAPGIDQIVFALGAVLALTGTGSATLKVSRSITLATTSGITTVNGALTVEANQQVTPTAGTFQGINMAANSLIQATGIGVVTVKGRGGDSGGSQRGIENSNGDIIGGTSGTMIIEGIGGASGTSGSHDGVRLFSGGAISSNGAHIMITGTAGGTGSTTSNIGVNVSTNGVVAATGTGIMTITGHGGVATGVNQFGFSMGSSSSILTNSGNIIIHGYGGDNSSANSAHGVAINGGTIIAGGAGNVVLHGEGGALGTSSDGVNIITSPAKISSDGGTVTVTGVGGGAGASASCSGVAVLTGAQISAGGSGTVLVQGTGGIGTGALNYGVEVSGAGALITSNGGAVQVTGNGGTLSTITGNNHGVIVDVNAKISAAGAGSTTVTGFGGGTNATTNNFGVFLNNSGEVSATGTGHVTINGTGGFGSGNLNGGVSISNSGLVTSSGGNVTITGLGGGSGGGTQNYGVYAFSLGSISAGGSGIVTVNGTGGATTGNFNYGVVIAGGGGATSSGGNVIVIGQGGGAVSSQVNIGVDVHQGGYINAGGSGNVIVTGIGGNTSGDGNTGVFVWLDESYITSSGGDVTVTGTGGGGGSNSANSTGVYVANGEISAAGGGDVNITGTGSTATGNNNNGVLIEGSTALITSGGGPIVITGHAGGNANSRGINIIDQSEINTLNDGGTVHLIANSMNLGAQIITDPAYFVWLSPFTNGMDINLGTAGDINNGPLNLTDQELDSVSTGYLLIGNSTTGDITTTANITRTSSTNISVQSNDNILLSQGSINTAGGDLSLKSGASPDAVYPLVVGTDVNCSTLYLYGQIEFEIDGLVSDMSYTQMNVTGSINLGDAYLQLTGSHIPQPGQSFIIINNDGADAVQSTFVGLDEGATITSFLGGEYPATISYVGGTGNDVVITVASPHYLLSTTGNQIIFTDVAGNGETITMNQSGLNSVQFVVAGRSYSMNGGAVTALPVVTGLLGRNTVTINAGVGNDDIVVNAFTATMCHLTLNGGVGNDFVTMNGDIVFGTNANLNIDLQNDDPIPGEDKIHLSVNTNLTLVDLGIATLKCSRSINFNAGSSLTTVNGNLTLEANQQATPTTGTFSGIYLADNSLVEVTGAGTLDVKGKGGTTGNAQIGVYLYNGAILRGGLSGNHFVDGKGGATTSNDNRGIQVQLNGIITTNGGNLIINAQGGGIGASAHNHGIHLVQSGVISAGGMGSVTINTFGGLSTGIRNHGIHVYNAGSMITSGGGNVYVFGQSGGTGSSSFNHGVYVQDLGTITAGGLGTVTVEGTGGSAAGDRNDGVICYQEGATITSGGGDVIVNGIGGGSGASSFNYGVMIDNGGTITAGGVGEVHVNGTGGATNGARNVGVLVFLQNSFITSAGGNVTVTGTGGGILGNFQIGVNVKDGATITAGGAGHVTVTGTGGITTGGANYGVLVQESNATITSSGGDVTVTGLGGGNVNSSLNIGVSVNSSGKITAGGNGDVHVTGDGGVLGVLNAGILVTGTGSTIFSEAGDVFITANGGGNSTTPSFGLEVSQAGKITSTNSADITIIANGGVSNTASSQHGFYLEGPVSEVTTVDGTISITANGGANSTGFSPGILMYLGDIKSSGLGDVIIEANGSTGTGNANQGIFATNAMIKSHDGDINLTATGGGSLNTGQNAGLFFDQGSSIVSDGIGNILINANGGNTNGGSNSGIVMNGASGGIFTASGNIDIMATGHGAGTGPNNAGMTLSAGASIAAAGMGNITINGTAGQGTNSGHFGVALNGAESVIATLNGNINVTGTGGGEGIIGGQYGVYVYSGAQIKSIGNGNVIVEGSGGGGAGSDFNFGVLLSSENASISSAGGNITVTGFGGGSGTTSDNNYGVYLFYFANILCGQGGILGIQGTGGQGVGFGNVGVGMTTGQNQIIGGGPVIINGIEGGGATSFGLLFDADATITTDSLAGNITLVANSILNFGTIETPDSNMVTIRPHTAGVTIHAGAVTDLAGGPLMLSDAELDLIHTGHLKIGSAQTDSIKVITDISRIDTLDITLLAGGHIVLDTGAIVMSSGNLLLDCGPSPKAIMPLTYGTEMETDTLIFGSDLLFNIEGIIPDSLHDQLHINGVINLTGVDLKLSGSYFPSFTDTFMIINNDSTDAIIGTFTGLPEGGTIANFLGTMLSATITYTGGDGNDAVISMIVPHYLITDTGGHLQITDLAGNGETLTVSEMTGNLRFNVPGRNYSYNFNSITGLPFDVSLAGIDSITINTRGGNDNIIVNTFVQQLPGLTINGGIGNDILTMAGDIIFIPGADFNADMQNDNPTPGVDQVIINPNVDIILADTGSATLKVSRNILCNTGSALRTEHGNIQLEANQQTISTAENFSGVTVQNSQISVTGTGSLIVKGKAGTTNNLNHGVYILLGGDIIGGTAGTVYVEGVSAQSTTQSCHGVLVTNAGSSISSLGADVEVIGESLGAGGNIHSGIDLDAGGNISAGGSGNVVVHGTGGVSPGTNNNGVRINSANSSISSSGGNITVTGIGGGNITSSISAGISILASGSIIAGGNGTVEVTGTGGLNSGNSNCGIAVAGTNSIISSNGGNVTAIGIGGGTALSVNNRGVQITSGGKITAGAMGDVYVEGTGGPSEGGVNHGVHVSLSGSSISSSGGNVHVVGLGGGSADASSNTGVFVGSAGLISAGNQGVVTIEGSGALTYGIANNGVHVQSTGSMISSSGGAVNVIGLGGGYLTASTGIGVFVETNGIISAGPFGDISIEGEGGTGTGTGNMGVSINSGGMVASDEGNINVTGTAGLNGSSNMIGVSVVIAAIAATGSGNVNVEGIGGPGTANNNYGVYVNASNGKITSEDGNITVTGQGGGFGSSGGNNGIHVNNGLVESTGVGNISLTGNGGLSAGAGNTGIVLNSSSALIKTNSGNIHLTGNGGGTGTSLGHSGIQIINGAEVYAGSTGDLLIEATGGNNTGSGNVGFQINGNTTLVRVDEGNLTIYGTGGANGTFTGYGVEIGSSEIRGSVSGHTLIQGTGSQGTGSFNYGIFMTTAGGTITSQGGNLEIIGIEGNGSNGFGMKIQNNTLITTTGAGGNIDIKANSLQCQAGIQTQPSDTLTIQPYTSAIDINLAIGSDIIGGPLHISDQELDSMVTGHLVLGSTIAGDILMGGSVTRSALTHVDLISGADISCNPGTLNTNGGNLQIDPGTSPFAFRPISIGTDVVMDTLSISGNLAIEINGLLPDVQHHQLKVTGRIDLTGTDLALSGSYIPLAVDSFVIINNDLNDMIIGTFNTLAEGDTIIDLLGDTLEATITYAGGDGNDVVLRMIQPCISPSDVMISATADTACIGTTITLELESGNLGGATEWHWYSNGCGTNSEGTGTTIMVTPTDTTTYYVRGEGGCVINDECVSKTIVIHPFPDATIYQEFADSCYFIDRLFRPESPEIPGATYTWDFGPTAIPTSASGYGPHIVYYTVPGTKNVKLVVHPNADGAQCSDSSSVMFIIYNCPGQIVGDVKSDMDIPIAGVNVRLFADADTNGIADNTTAIRSVFTTSLGVFAMASLTPGHYVIVQTQPAGWISVDDLDTSDDGDVVANFDSLDNIIPVTILPREEDEDNKFVERPAPGTITGVVFQDFDLDDFPDANEGLSGITVQLFKDANTNGIADTIEPFATTVTAGNGDYSFLNIPVGHYVLVEIQDPTFVSIKDFDPSNDADVVPNTNMTNDTLPVTLINGETDAHNYFIDVPVCGSVVTNTFDDGPGSLRQALACTGVGDTIHFHPALTGMTIEITSALLMLTTDVVVESVLSPQVILASQIEGMFHVDEDAAVELRGVTVISGLSQGNTGAAFENHGILTLHNTTIIRNPLFNSGEYLIRNHPGAELTFSGECYLEKD